MMIELVVLPDRLGLCRLPSECAIPDWALQGTFFSVTKTKEEMSILCPEDNIPPAVSCHKGWRAIRVAGKLEFSQIGILSSLAEPLALARISILALSTFDTDYLFVVEENLPLAMDVLQRAGHSFAAV